MMGSQKNLCSLTYITVNSAIQCIQQLGQGTLLTKIDVKSAFRLLPVHPSDHHLLAMEWDRNLYIDTCLPFGLRSAPKLFNVLADYSPGYSLKRVSHQYFTTWTIS